MKRYILLGFMLALFIGTGLAQNATTIDVNASQQAFIEVPQEFVVCTGWHALCTASPDCKMNGDKADCDCLRVNETHIVETS